ncbi:MAG TPA: AMP-binding protein [Acidimicrobiales bacterium]
MDRSITLGDILPRLATVRGERPLVEEPHPGGGLRLTYPQAADRMGRMAAAIAEAAGRGDRVVLAMPNGYDQFLASLAACRAGAVAVPVNPHMRPAEIDHVVTDSGAALVVHEAGEILAGTVLPAGEAEARRGRPGDVAAIFYTSGTTGSPKGAELTHRGLAGSMAAATVWPAGIRRDEIVAALPVAHIMGFAVLLAAAAVGVPLYSLTRFRADAVLDAIEGRRSTIFIGVPAMYRMLLEAGAEDRDLTSIRLWASGADVMPAELARRFQRMGAAVTLPLVNTAVGDAMFVEGYGMVETGGAVAMRLSPPGVAASLPVIGDSLGIPLPGYRLRVVDEDGEEVGPGQIGELVVKGPGVLTGYHGDAAATAEVLDADGWLRTGDLVRRGAGGLVSFAARAKDVIKSGGYSVYAVEIERAMEEHPDVVEAAALGVPDERLGERTVVAVRLREGATADEQDLLAWGGNRLSGYKRPRMVRIVDDLPRTGTDKVAKRELVALFAA